MAGDPSGPATSAVLSTYRDFYASVLAALGLPATQGNENALAAVAQIEGINDRYNPLNSVVAAGNSTPFNSVGVQDYKSFDNGVRGTVALLRGSSWAEVRSALAQGDTGGVLHAFADVYSSWGSHPNFGAVTPSQEATILSSRLGANTGTGLPAAIGNMNGAAAGGGTVLGTSGAAGTSWTDALPWNWGGGLQSIVNAVLAFVMKMGFVLTGITLVALGAYKASAPGREKASQGAAAAAAT